MDTSRKPAIARQTPMRAGAVGFFAAILAATAVIPAGPERDIIIPTEESFALSENRVVPFALVSRNIVERPSPKNQSRPIATRQGATDFRAVLGIRSSSSTSADDFMRLIAGGLSPFSFISVSGGTQTPKWGRAKAVPSIDVLDSKIDPFNPDATREQAPGISANIATTEWLSFSVLALEGKHEAVITYPVIPVWINDATFALKANIAAGPTDISFGGVRKIGPTGNEEPAFFADFAQPFAHGRVYGEWESEWIKSWQSAATAGFSIDIPWRHDRSITCTGEFRYQEKNEYSRSMLYAEVNGNELVDGLSVTMSALAAPDANEVVLSSGASQRIGERLKVWTKYDYLFGWPDYSGAKQRSRADSPYGYSMKIGLSATL